MFFINCWFTNASGLSILMAKITWTTEITNENVKNMFSNHVCNSRYLVFFLCFDFFASFGLVGCIENFDWTWLSLIKGLNRNSYATNKKIFSHIGVTRVPRHPCLLRLAPIGEKFYKVEGKTRGWRNSPTYNFVLF